MVTGHQPGVIAQLNVLAKRPPQAVPRFMRHVHLAESYQLELRSLTHRELSDLRATLDEQELWLSRIVLHAREHAEFGYRFEAAGELKAVLVGSPAMLANRMRVPAHYLLQLCRTGQLVAGFSGIIFTLTRQALRT